MFFGTSIAVLEAQYVFALEKLKRQREEIERQDYDIKWMRGPAFEADFDWRIPLPCRPMIDGDL